MLLTPEQHKRIAAAYREAAQDKSEPPEKRDEFERKARLFESLAKRAAFRRLH